MNRHYTNFVCEPRGQVPGWAIAAVFAIPILLVALDILDGLLNGPH